MRNVSCLPSSRRSLGVKRFVVCGLAMLMVIPACLISRWIEAGSQRREVIGDIGSHVGGQHSFLGPILAVPYTQSKSPAELARLRMYFVFPVRASATPKVDTQERGRSLFKVPVFPVDGKPPGAEFDWDNAEILIGFSDARGALSDASMTFAGKTLTLVPPEMAQYLATGRDPSPSFRLTLCGTRAAVPAKPDAQFRLRSSLRFSGARRVAVFAYGKANDLPMPGDLPGTGFEPEVGKKHQAEEQGYMLEATR